MAEQKKQTQKTKEKVFGIRRIYIKDISFESPRAPFSFSSQWKPEVDVQIHNSNRPLEKDLHESTLKISLTGKLEDKTVFIIEVLQAGIFHIVNMNDKEKEKILEIVCPTTLFPYIREHIDNLLTKANFPPLMLAPINFEAIYHKRKQATRQATTIHQQDKTKIN